MKTSVEEWETQCAEIIATFEDAGIPGGAYQAAAELYSRLEQYADASELPRDTALIDTLLSRDRERHHA